MSLPLSYSSIIRSVWIDESNLENDFAAAKPGFPCAIAFAEHACAVKRAKYGVGGFSGVKFIVPSTSIVFW